MEVICTPHVFTAIELEHPLTRERNWRLCIETRENHDICAYFDKRAVQTRAYIQRKDSDKMGWCKARGHYNALHYTTYISTVCKKEVMAQHKHVVKALNDLKTRIENFYNMYPADDHSEVLAALRFTLE